MKLASKIAASLALLGAFATAQAESITFGVNIPPIASLIVRDGVLKTSSALYFAGGTIDPTAHGAVVGGFTVVTNMPKWNIYFSFANQGALVNQTGTQLKDNAGTAIYLGNKGTAPAASTDCSVWLSTADKINAQDDEATPKAPLAAGLPLTNAAAAASPLVSPLATNNTLTGAIASATKSCTGGAACVFTAPWLNATDLTTATFDITTGLTSAGTSVANVAGTYTETMYLTLVTSY